VTQPPVEYASAAGYPIAGQESRYDRLAGPTGLPVSVIRELVSRHAICDLYDVVSGNLLPREELRERFGPPPMTGKEALEVVRDKRLGAAPITPAQAQCQLLRLRRAGYDPL
jgi:hypothetical protein